LNTYAIIRRGIATPENVEQVAASSARELAGRPARLRRIRSYVLAQEDGRLGSICIYEAASEDDIREHGRAAGLAVDEVIPVAVLDVERPIPPRGPQWTPVEPDRVVGVRDEAARRGCVDAPNPFLRRGLGTQPRHNTRAFDKVADHDVRNVSGRCMSAARCRSALAILVQPANRSRRMTRVTQGGHHVRSSMSVSTRCSTVDSQPSWVSRRCGDHRSG
jgi:hypothetical protein